MASSGNNTTNNPSEGSSQPSTPSQTPPPPPPPPPPSSSSNQPPPSSRPNPPPSSSPEPSQTPSTNVVTSVVTQTAGSKPATITQVVTLTQSQTGNNNGASQSISNGQTSSTSPASLQPGQNGSSNGSGLSTAGKTAIAVVIPVVAVALLVLAGLFLWRKRKQRKNAADARRKEVEEYGYNPNHDPTLPQVRGLGSAGMMEDDSGYRGWGNASAFSNRKPSTTLSGGMGAFSDNSSNPDGYKNPTSPSGVAGSDGRSSDPLMNSRHETMDSDGLAALGGAPNSNTNRSTDLRRGPSNASSSYSVGNHSDNSGEIGYAVSPPNEYYDTAYYQTGPYGEGNYGGGGQVQQPVIRDVSARRNTRIESPSIVHQQGISQNF